MPDSAPGALGVLGGTFDPVHSAHLALARTAKDALNLDAVLWVPAGQPRHRQAPLATAAQRLAMVRIALAGQPHFAVDATEALSEEPSYTVPTLQRLRATYGPARPLVLLLGADAFLGLTAWYRWQELFALAHLGVATRPGFTLDAQAMPAPLAAEFAKRTAGDVHAACGTIRTFRLDAGTVSATETRARLAQGADPGNWLPPGILDYIRTHHLYRS